MNKWHYPLLTPHTIWGLWTDGVKSGYCSSLTDEIAHFSVFIMPPPNPRSIHTTDEHKQSNRNKVRKFSSNQIKPDRQNEHVHMRPR